MCGVYKITCLENKLVYIGQSIDIVRRWRRERYSAFNPNCKEYNRPLMIAFRNYASNPKEVLKFFSFEILEECKRTELNNKEQYYMTYYHSYIGEKGYNVARCGSGCGHYNKLNEEIFYNIVKLLRDTNISQSDIGSSYNISLKTINMINTGKQNRHDELDYPIRKIIPTRYCKTCGKKLYHASKTDFCQNFLCRYPLPDYQEFIDKIYYQGKTFACKFYGYSVKVINRWLKEYLLPIKKEEFKKWYRKEILKEVIKKEAVIDKYSLAGEYIATYKTTREAGSSIGKGKHQYTHITDCTSGRLPYAYGYIWRKREIDAPIDYQLNHGASNAEKTG